MIRHIPSKETRRWSGIYPGNYYGTLWKTRNIDLDRNEGFVGLSRRMERIEDSGEFSGPLTAGFDVRGFLRSNADCEDKYWGITTTGLLKTDSSATPLPSDDWDTDGLDSTPGSNLRDFTVHARDSKADCGRDKIIVTTDTDIFVLNDTGNSEWTGNWWVTKHSQPGLNTDASSKPVEYFPFRKISIVGDGNLTHTSSLFK